MGCFEFVDQYVHTSNLGDEVPELCGLVEGLKAVHGEDEHESPSGTNAQLSHGREVVRASRVQDLDRVEQPVRCLHGVSVAVFHRRLVGHGKEALKKLHDQRRLSYATGPENNKLVLPHARRVRHFNFSLCLSAKTERLQLVAQLDNGSESFHSFPYDNVVHLIFFLFFPPSDAFKEDL